MLMLASMTEPDGKPCTRISTPLPICSAQKDVTSSAVAPSVTRLRSTGLRIAE